MKEFRANWRFSLLHLASGVTLLLPSMVDAQDTVSQPPRLNPMNLSDSAGELSCANRAARDRFHHLVGGSGADACSFRIPPSDFNPMNASEAELESWGYPQRPEMDDPGIPHTNKRQTYDARLAQWKNAVAALDDAKVQRPIYTVCTRDQKDFKGPPALFVACHVPHKPFLFPAPSSPTPERSGSIDKNPARLKPDM